MLAIQHYSTPQTLPNQKVLSFQFSDPSDGVLVKFHSLQITSRKPTWLKDVEGQQLPVTKCYQTMQTAVRTEPSFVSLFEFEANMEAILWKWNPLDSYWILRESEPFDMFGLQAQSASATATSVRSGSHVGACRGCNADYSNSRNEWCCINTEENTRLDEEKTK